jgi:tRNA1(Val) A37 N6-methylase TrmN6
LRGSSAKLQEQNRIASLEKSAKMMEQVHRNVAGSQVKQDITIKQNNNTYSLKTAS